MTYFWRNGEAMVGKHPRVQPNTAPITVDPRVTAKVKTAQRNSDACLLVTEKKNFQTKHGSIFGLWSEDMWGRLRYMVYSYGTHWPIFGWDEEAQRWFQNGDRYSLGDSWSMRTSDHMSDAAPRIAASIPRLSADDMKVMHDHGLVAVLVNHGAVQDHPDLPVPEYAAFLQPMIHDPRLGEMLRRPGGPDDLDVGIGAWKEQQAQLACVALANLGWTPLMLGLLSYGEVREENPYHKARKLLRLTRPCNAHREMLYGTEFEPCLGTKAGRHVVKFYRSHYASGATTPDTYPVWLEFESKRAAREGLRTLNAMRQMHATIAGA